MNLMTGYKSKMETVDILRKQNKELIEKIVEQDKLIKDMRDVLRFCAMEGVGTYYQQQSAKEMVVNSRKFVWSDFNQDGTYTKKYKNDLKKRFSKDKVKEILDEINEMEAKLR